jgi:hypothetical protein
MSSALRCECKTDDGGSSIGSRADTHPESNAAIHKTQLFLFTIFPLTPMIASASGQARLTCIRRGGKET